MKGEKLTLRCEVCGHKIHTEPITAVIEGARLTVCVECAKHGKIVHQEEITLPKTIQKKPLTPMPVLQKKPSTPSVQITQELTQDYANKIRVAREKTGLTHEELGKKINEKASVLRNLEARKMEPNNQLASKLEHMLKIKLLVPISDEKTVQIPKSANEELTLGDLIEIDEKDSEAATERKPS
ncbi:MAG TPA: multiprotein bridging factor aMBF1 [Candidatus Acidoferrales bacterium]|nr:multiprotein bridging factor aMBF1 [Candidatus Acidoferrales bacterium]